ncbi:MAG: mechanosensitive ion channel family protein [Lachnospiraceae bacterium]|nr:mechanosensitive ion channel family protein [Lachnospiraceae bacterium]
MMTAILAIDAVTNVMPDIATGKTPMAVGVRIVLYILPFVVAYLAGLVLDRFLSNERLHGKLHLVLLRSIIRIAIWMAAIITAVSFVPSFSRTWETVVASSGIAAVVLGLAAQSTLANVFAGIALSVTQARPFDIGDRIQVGTNDPGFVVDITLRHVAICTFQNEVIYVPNSVVSSSTIINYTKMTSYSYPVMVSVAYGTDVEKAMRVMREVIASHPKYVGGADVPVLCRELGDSGITLRAMMTTGIFADNPGACSDCRVEILKRFAQEGIEIPYPHVDVTMRESR